VERSTGTKRIICQVVNLIYWLASLAAIVIIVVSFASLFFAKPLDPSDLENTDDAPPLFATIIAAMIWAPVWLARRLLIGIIEP
jgi:hypothetical protein